MRQQIRQRNRANRSGERPVHSKGWHHVLSAGRLRHHWHGLEAIQQHDYAGLQRFRVRPTFSRTKEQRARARARLKKPASSYGWYGGRVDAVWFAHAHAEEEAALRADGTEQVFLEVEGVALHRCHDVERVNSARNHLQTRTEMMQAGDKQTHPRRECIAANNI